MPTELSLRIADADDAERLAAIQIASRAAAPMPPAPVDAAALRDRLADRITADEVWVAELDGMPIGYAGATPTWLDDLYVVPEAAGQGVGTALLDLVKAQRPDGFRLWVFEANDVARAFYRRRGLVELEHTDGSANPEGEADLAMAWPGHDPLRFFRGLIDAVDAELGDLLNRRAALTAAVQPLKATAERDPDREREIAQALARRVPRLGEQRVARIMHAIITESLDAAR